MAEDWREAFGYSTSSGAILKLQLSPALVLKQTNSRRGYWVAPAQQAMKVNGYLDYGNLIEVLEVYDNDGNEVFPEELVKYL